MATNQIGIRNSNVIVPYTATTKRTKVISITNVAHLVVTGTNITANTILGAYVQAYADSNGLWRLRFNVHCPVTSTGVRTNATLTFSSTYAVTFKSGPYQACTAFLGGSGAAVTARTTSNTAAIYIAHASAAETEYQLSGDVELESEPTWAAANMEGVLPVDVYIPPASAGIAGLVNNAAGNTAGTPILGKTDGVAVASGYVGEALGTARTGTGGNTYSDRANTALSGSATVLLERNLNKGVYLLSAIAQAYSSSGVLTAKYYVAATATQLTNTYTVTNAQGAECLCTIPAMPIVITTDSTPIRLYGYTTSGTRAGEFQEWFITRIA
jgi:hypothetical protein